MTGAGVTSRILTAVLMAVALLAWTAPARADFDQDRRDCNGENPRLGGQIAACTRLIQWGRFTDDVIAIIYYNRGIAYGKDGQLAQAIQDYGRAIRLDPNFADAFYNRGLTLGRNGDFDRAIRDFKRAHALGNRNPFLLEKLAQHGALP